MLSCSRIVCCVAAGNPVCLCTSHGQAKVESCSVGFFETKRIVCLFYCFFIARQHANACRARYYYYGKYVRLKYAGTVSQRMHILFLTLW